jgi:putative DNA primase/helicase
MSQSATDQFRDAITQKGITPPDSLETDGKLHRFSSNGKPNDDAGWYVFYDGDIPAGAFGDFRSGQIVRSWVADIGRDLSSVEKNEFRNKQEEMRAAREADLAKRRAEAKDKAAGILRYSRLARDDHPYLLRKGVKAHGIREWKELLVIPMIDDTGKTQSLQLISGDGEKKFLSGGKMQGCYFVLGSLKDTDRILVAEGYATAATVHEITGLPVIVAFNAGNLLAVSKSVRAQHPSVPLYLFADDDHKTKDNPGLTKAMEAAKAVGGFVIVPNFGNDRPEGATDFNDMAAHLGKDAVTRFFIDRFSTRTVNASVQAMRRQSLRLDA